MMETHAPGPVRRPRLLAGGALIAVLAVTGCGNRPTAATAQVDAAPAAGTASATTSPAMTDVGDTSPSSPEEAKAAARPNGNATCGLLSAATVQNLLGGTVTGAKDVRKNEAARSQLDGCSYASPNGTQLSYAVWRLKSVGTQHLVEQSLPSTQLGARPFAPKVGQLSAGAVLVTGPITVAQVNAIQDGRLVLATATGKDGNAATRTATDAASALIAARTSG